MTSLIYRHNPHVVKLDRRYRLYPQGFRFRVDFDTRGEGNWQRWSDAITWCERTWGREHDWGTSTAGTFFRTWNHNYRTHGTSKYSQRQLFLRSEEDLTMLLLVIGK